MFLPKYFVLGGIICNKINERKKRTFDELFPPNYIVLGGNIFSEINIRKKHKSEKLYPPNYIFRDKLYFMK